MNNKVISLIVIFLCLISPVVESESEKVNIEYDNSIRLTFLYKDDDMKPAKGVEVYLKGEFMGVTDKDGKLLLDSLPKGFHEITMKFPMGNGRDGTMGGFYIRKKFNRSEMHIKRFAGPGNSTDRRRNSLSPTTQKKIEIKLPKEIASRRNTSIKVSFDSSIPEEVKEYIRQLIDEVDPIVRKLLGPPIQNENYRLVYSPDSHKGFAEDKKVSITDKLPSMDLENDSHWDKWFINEYIHKYLQGRGIPIPGTRSSENRAQTISNIICTYLNQNNIRKIAPMEARGIYYYLNLYPTLEPLGPDTLLNQGTSFNKDSSFRPENFLWEPESYNRINAFTIEYAKAVWTKLFYARYLETGQFDFFLELQNRLYRQNPKKDDEFYDIIDQIVSKVDGLKASIWLKNTAAFNGKVEKQLTARLLPVNGDYWHISGVNNPDYIYPFVIARTPGKIVETDVVIEIIDQSGKEIYSKEVKTGFPGQSGQPAGIEVPLEDLSPGLYLVRLKGRVNGRRIRTSRSFHIIDGNDNMKITDYPIRFPDKVVVKRQNTVRVKYDDSVPQDVQNYLDKLVNEIDPVIRGFVGEPNEDRLLTIQHDPDGLAGMSRQYGTLNLKRLPRINGQLPDKGFDSFFFIEYYHMFHAGRDIPITELRYGENISQAMKVIIANYLRQQGIRDTYDKSIEYYLNLNGILEDLGPGILINNGITHGNPGGNSSIRTLWKTDSDFQQFMNVFTLEYSLSIWLKLADARYQKSGKYDFFKRLQKELNLREPDNRREFYRLVERVVDTRIDGVRVRNWLKKTSLLKGVPKETVFVKALVVRGNIHSIYGIDNPDYIYPFVVKREEAAELLAKEVKIEILNSDNAVVFSRKMKISMEGSYKGVKVPKQLEPGKYTARLSVIVDGSELIDEKDFKITDMEMVI